MNGPDILLAMNGLSKVYDYPLNEPLIQIWETVLGDLTETEFADAVKKYVRDPENKFFPKPGQIYGLARPKLDFESEAAFIADRIFYSLRSYGTDTVGTERAKNRIGDVGWAYVLNAGGWSTFVSGVQSDADVPILKSQCRKSIVAIMHRKQNGLPMLPGSEKQSLGVDLKKLGVQMKSIVCDDE